MNKLKVGVVGVGYLGSIHARIYKENKNCELVGLCDINNIRLKEITQRLNVRGFFDYKQLFDKVEAVSIVTPTKSHYPIARDFLKKGIHVFIEKPFTISLKEADNLIKLAQKNKLILQVGHIERFNSAFSATQRLIKDPKFIECHRLSPFLGRSLDIGVVMDLMIHDIDIVLGLVKSPIKKIEAVGVRVVTEFEDIANARISFKNGCIANLTSSRVSDEVVRKIRIFQKDAYISLDYRAERATLYRKKGHLITKESLPIERQEPLKKELDAFVRCVAKNQKPLVSGEIAKEALKVALEIQRKIWQRQPIY